MSSAFYGRLVGIRRLDLDLAEAVLPDGGEGSDTVLAEVDQDVPRKRILVYNCAQYPSRILTWHHRPWRSP